MDQLTLPAGTIVKVGGLPFALAEDTVVNGTAENYRLATVFAEKGGDGRFRVGGLGPLPDRPQPQAAVDAQMSVYRFGPEAEPPQVPVAWPAELPTQEATTDHPGSGEGAPVTLGELRALGLISSGSMFSSLMLEVFGRNGEVWRFWADGRTEGFPADAIVSNHAVRLIARLLAEQKRARGGAAGK